MRSKVTFAFAILFFLIFLVGLKTAKLFPLAFQLLFTNSVSLNKTDDHINILLLGIAGGTHEGPSLSDTILLASLDPLKNKITLVSIPRDFWIPDLNEKINTAYAIGEGKRRGGGLILSNGVV